MTPGTVSRGPCRRWCQPPKARRGRAPARARGTRGAGRKDAAERAPAAPRKPRRLQRGSSERVVMANLSRRGRRGIGGARRNGLPGGFRAVGVRDGLPQGGGVIDLGAAGVEGPAEEAPVDVDGSRMATSSVVVASASRSSTRSPAGAPRSWATTCPAASSATMARVSSGSAWAGGWAWRWCRRRCRRSWRGSPASRPEAAGCRRWSPDPRLGAQPGEVGDHPVQLLGAGIWSSVGTVPSAVVTAAARKTGSVTTATATHARSGRCRGRPAGGQRPLRATRRRGRAGSG